MAMRLILLSPHWWVVLDWRPSRVIWHFDCAQSDFGVFLRNIGKIKLLLRYGSLILFFTFRIQILITLISVQRIRPVPCLWTLRRTCSWWLLRRHQVWSPTWCVFSMQITLSIFQYLVGSTWRLLCLTCRYVCGWLSNGSSAYTWISFGHFLFLLRRNLW